MSDEDSILNVDEIEPIVSMRVDIDVLDSFNGK